MSDKTASLPTWQTLEERTESWLNYMGREQAAYINMCNEYAEQGYRAPVCIHGTSRWTDYDNICGYCEGDYWNEHTSPEELKQFARINAEAEIQLEVTSAHAAALMVNYYYDKGWHGVEETIYHQLDNACLTIYTGTDRNTQGEPK